MKWMLHFWFESTALGSEVPLLNFHKPKDIPLQGSCRNGIYKFLEKYEVLWEMN